MATRTAPSMRVLTRSKPTTTPSLPPIPSSSYSASASASASTSAPSDPQPPSPGTVVVGFISRRPDYSTHLINRVIDFPAFGSGNLDKILQIDKDELKDWFKLRRISYYHDDEKGVLYLQFCSMHCPVVCSPAGVVSGFDSPVEEQEFGDLQGMLFVFSVCHVVIFITEGSRFNTQMLKDFRLLQSAKNALAPYIRSRTMPMSSSRHPTSSAGRNVPKAPSDSVSPNRSRISNRGSSGISIMSGLGSYASLFPGQCTPVILFVFIDDYLDSTNSASCSEDMSESSSLNNNSASLSGLPRSGLPTKGSGSVVMLARPVNKSEGGFKKKLQLALETQIRFLMKKCRTLSGSDNGQPGSRSSGTSSSAPLFLLDASRIAILLDRVTNQTGESLEFAMELVEEVLKGKATSNSLLLENNHSQNTNKEDAISIREFILRQCDVLRGRGGLMGATNSGGGMVAVAAAAAAASVAQGKAFATPELPNLNSWVSMSEVVLDGILAGRSGFKDESEINKRKPRHRNVSPSHGEGLVTHKAEEPPDIAVSWLERGKGINAKFSTSWCQKALPMAKEIYSKDLPPCYSTSQHEVRLQRALHTFHSMVKGPSVSHFAKVLEEDCGSIWREGRQQCDAISLTGKPCVYLRHNVEDGGLLHSSEYVFLHACACGRSRKLREDPFDFESANGSNCFFDCDKVLPALELPDVKSSEPIKPSSWSLIRVGSSKYYEPSKGLMQGGFSSSQKFLLEWIIYLDNKRKSGNQLPVNANEKDTLSRSSRSYMLELNPDAGNTIEDGQSKTSRHGTQNRKAAADGNNISFGRGLPNSTIKKPFAEVVAGSAVADSAFPPLQRRKPSQSVSENGNKQSAEMERNCDHEEASNLKDNSSDPETANRKFEVGFQIGDPFLTIGSYKVPANMSPGENIELDTSPEQAVAYVGFEHECPHGHRFLLNPKHLNELGPFYSSQDERNVISSETTEDSIQTRFTKSNVIGTKVHSGASSFGKKKLRNLNKSREISSNGHNSRQEKGCHQPDSMSAPSFELEEDISEGLKSAPLDSCGSAFSMLNRSLPLYMNCPCCKNSNESAKARFSGTVSQLQRIFLVTPPFPVVLATSPVIQFQASCLPSAVPDVEQRRQFSLGCQVVLPPESFLVIRLPFVYGVQVDDQTVHPLNALEHRPEQTAWIEKGTALFLASKGIDLGDGISS